MASRLNTIRSYYSGFMFNSKPGTPPPVCTLGTRSTPFRDPAICYCELLPLDDLRAYRCCSDPIGFGLALSDGDLRFGLTFGGGHSFGGVSLRSLQLVLLLLGNIFCSRPPRLPGVSASV